MKFLQFFRGKETKNAGWLIGGKIAQMIISFFVGILTARYLGPGNYGLINYASAYIGFFSAFCALGLNSVIIKDFVDNPEDQGKTLGSALFLRLASSLLSAIMIICIVAIVDKDDPLTLMVVALCAVALPFHIFDTINYWFQAKYQSKTTSIASLIGYAITSVYKIILLILQMDVRWFAIATAIDYLIIAVCLLVAYRKYDGPRFTFSKEKAKHLLKNGAPYILSGMMVAIYAQTDKLMLKQMLDETAVGYYSTATALCGMWVFILQAIIDSLYPTIIRLNEQDEQLFNRKNRQLYAIIFYVSVFVSLIFSVFGELIIRILYGDAFLPAVEPLRIITWYTAFSYLGVARDAWIVSKNKQKYLFYIYLVAVIVNVGLNVLFIPIWGPAGAALTSLITQIVTSIIFPLFIKPLRPNAKLMLEAILFKDVFSRRNETK